MNTEKKSFVLYNDYKETFEDLTDEEAGKLIKHIFSYINSEDKTLDDRYLKIAFNPIKRQLERDFDKWEGIKQKRSKAGKKSAEVRKQKSTNSTSVKSVQHTSTNSTVNDNVNVNDNVIYYDTDSFLIDLEENSDWIDTFYSKYKIKKGKLTSVVNDFINNLKLKNKEHTSLKDTLEHFTNWCNIQDNKSQFDKYKNTTWKKPNYYI